MAPPVCYFPFPTFCFDFGAKIHPVRDTSRSWLLRTCSRGLSSFVRPKRSERRSAVDRAFGRARQARSTWPWSERAQVGASVAQKDGSRARGPPLRAGQHRIPPARPIGGIALISMLEPAFASLLAEKPATACHSPLKSDAYFPYASRWGKLVTCQRTSCWCSDRNRGSPKELPRRRRAARSCSSSRRGCQAACQVAVDSLPPAEANDRCARACRCW